MEPGSHSTQPIVLCREIHKNGMLKKYNSEKRTGFVRKSERVWTVFCLHDDAEAFLEFYSDQKMALNHRPDSFVSLNHVHHISQSICASSDECEFVVTLPTQVVRLAAPSWEITMEWVETIRNKLRELRVLAPKENVYSKMPEPRPGLLPTRDPTSPLPLPPVGPRVLVPGVESPIRQTPSTSTPAEPSSPVPSVGLDASQQPVSTTSEQQDNAADINESGVVSLTLECETSVEKSNDIHMIANNGHHEGPSSSTRHENGPANCRRNFQSSGSSVIVVTGETASEQERVFSPQANDRPPHHNIPMALPSTSNITVIEVPPPQSPHYEQLFIPNALRNPEVADPRTDVERVPASGLIPRVPSRPKREVPSESRAPREKWKDQNMSDSASANHVSSPEVESHQHKSIVRVKSLKECTSQTSVVRLTPGSSTSVVSVVEETVPLASPSSSQDIVPPLNVAIQPVPSNLDVKDIPLIGGHQRRRRRSCSTDASQVSVPARSLGGADLIRVAPSEVHDPAPTTPLTLREAQVFQLRKEMRHPGGVRLKLRCKDSLNSIALVDILNAVWIAGWKQKEHPLLCNALHIGDELVSVGEVAVKTVAEAHKLLRACSAATTAELVVRRLPMGRVLMLQRPRREASVGLIPDPSVPGEVRVEPEGVAARAGLPLCATAMDRLTLTPWTLTEVNGRPLNLFCKASDINIRLDAVGKELSVLVQPSDFIHELRKQLKNIRGYKEYLLQ